MASFTLSQLWSSNINGVYSPTPSNGVLMANSPRSDTARFKLTCQAATTPADHVAVLERRKLMKLLLFGSIGLPSAGMLLPSCSHFLLPSGGGTVAKDDAGNSIIASELLKTHKPGDRTLTQGLKGDPTYLMVENNRTLAAYGINAVCTHLGCIVPWNTVEKKFICPCHGSQYNNEGTVIKGPAPLSLELANVDIKDGKVVFAPWTKTDFRTGNAPWWS